MLAKGAHIMSSYRQSGTVLTDRAFSVPLDHDSPRGERIEVFAREVVAADQASASLPWLMFLQGGPGFGAPRPHGRDSWLDRALAYEARKGTPKVAELTPPAPQ